MLRRASKFLAERLKQIIPDAFVFAILLTLVAGLCAWIFTDSSGGEVLDAWFTGFLVIPSMMVLMRPRRREATVLNQMLEQGDEATSMSIAQEAEQLKLPSRTLSDKLNHGRLPVLRSIFLFLQRVVSGRLLVRPLLQRQNLPERRSRRVNCND